MNILLAFPRFRYISGQPPLGIASIYSYLKQKIPKVNITVFDGTFVKNKFRSFGDIIKNNTFDIVGFSLMNTMISEVYSLAKMTRRYSPAAKIVIGGPQATVDPEYFIRLNLADIIIAGEGEITFFELVKNGCNPSGVKGTVYRKKGEIIYEPERDKVSDLDELPIASREIFDMDSYMRAWNSMDVVRNGLKGTSVMVSRGCPYQCTFCQPTLKEIFGQRIRFFSPEKVIEELDYLRNTFHMDAFMFEDDTFIINKKWVSRVCDLIIKRKQKILWCCNIRADLCDYDILKKMYEAGLRKINIGIESASQHILDDVFKKGITIQQVTDAVKMAKKIGLHIQGYFMLGHPTETKKGIENTIRFARKLAIDEASFSITTPLPGTYLFDNDKEFIEQNFENHDYYSACSYKYEALQVKPWQIKLYKKYAYLQFYSKPSRLMKQIRNLFSKDGLRKFIYKLERV